MVHQKNQMIRSQKKMDLNWGLSQERQLGWVYCWCGKELLLMVGLDDQQKLTRRIRCLACWVVRLMHFCLVIGVAPCCCKADALHRVFLIIWVLVQVYLVLLPSCHRCQLMLILCFSTFELRMVLLLCLKEFWCWFSCSHGGLRCGW